MSSGLGGIFYTLVIGSFLLVIHSVTQYKFPTLNISQTHPGCDYYWCLQTRHQRKRKKPWGNAQYCKQLLNIQLARCPRCPLLPSAAAAVIYTNEWAQEYDCSNDLSSLLVIKVINFYTNDSITPVISESSYLFAWSWATKTATVIKIWELSL